MLLYRKEIDGLRALAVFAVLFFHFGFLESGYLGVDIFFVISAYLVTNKLLRQKSEGDFSLLDFYSKRIRRILPFSSFKALGVKVDSFGDSTGVLTKLFA